DRDFVTGLKQGNTGSDFEDDAGTVAPQDMIWQVVTLIPRAFLSRAFEKLESRNRLEDRTPDGVEVDAGSHYRYQRFIGSNFWQRHFIDVETLARVLLLRGQPVEHLDFILVG